jgi:Collagen triple helix repeat (20 copies)
VKRNRALQKEKESMLERIRNQVGTAGLVVAIVALIAALGGGAYAASGGLTGKQKQEVTKIAKKYAGKNGAPGSAGEKGAAGAAGTQGSQGPQGPQGEPGKSVTSTSLSVGDANCPAGGTKFDSASGTGYACDGEEGPEGPAGSPWVAGSLPSGATEMGTWAAGETPEEVLVLYVPISLSVPLASGASVPVIFVNQNGEEEQFENGGNGVPAQVCLGSAAHPTAPAGKLCVYAELQNGLLYNSSANATFGGANIYVSTFAHGVAKGAWALTAP